MGWLTGELLLAIAAVMTAIAAFLKTRAEVERTRAEIKLMLGQVHAELSPNHGSSARDAITRTEKATHDQTPMLQDIARDVGGIRQELRTLAEVDSLDRRTAAAEHDRMWDAINRERTQNP